METHDPKKTHPSGHEHHGVHLCYKCGWPFPNPHPSAKHRRAHKRVCGTLEGYKLLVDSEEKPHLNASDDEHDHSDEDHKTSLDPSTKVLERSEKGKGSGESGTRSNQSEEELFADASASFSENAGEVSSAVETILKSDLNPVQVVEAGATDQTVQQISSTSDSGTREYHDGEKTTTDGLVDRPGSVDRMDYLSYSTSALMEAHEPPALLDVYGNISSDSLIVKSESPLDHKPKPSADESAEVAIADPLLENVPHEADVKVNEENNREGDILGSAVLERGDSRNPNESEEKEESEKFHASSVTPNEFFSNKFLEDMFRSEKLAEDFSSGSVSLGQMGLTAESAQNKVDSMQRLVSANSADFVDATDAQLQENENFHVYSVPHDLPVIEQPEDLIKGFKDHRGMKSCQDDNLVQPDTRALQDRSDTFTNEDYSNLETKIRKEGSQTSLETPDFPDASEWKGENDKAVHKEGPLEGEKFSTKLSAASEVDQIDPDAVQGLEDEKVGDNKNAHVLPLPHDLPLVEQPENRIEDVKDHEGMKMDQFDNLASCETTVQEDNIVGSLDYSGSLSKKQKENAEASADVLEITAKAEEQVVKPLDKEMLIQREKNSGYEDPELKLVVSAGWDLSSPIGSKNDSNENGDKKRNPHAHSVPDDVVVVDQAKNMIENLKDRKEKNLYQLDDLASSGIVSQRENSNIPVSEDRSISEPKTEMGCNELSFSGMPDKQLINGSENESCSPINSEVPVGGKALLHSLQCEILENKDEVSRESSTEEVEKNDVETDGREELKDINTISLIVETSEGASKVLADASPEVIDTLSEVHGTIIDNNDVDERVKTDAEFTKKVEKNDAAIHGTEELRGSNTSSHDMETPESFSKALADRSPEVADMLTEVCRSTSDNNCINEKVKTNPESSIEKVEKNDVAIHETEVLKGINSSSLIVETPESASKLLVDASPEVTDMLTDVCRNISDNIGINERVKTDPESSIEKMDKNDVAASYGMEELKVINTSSLTVETPESASKVLADANPDVINMLTEVRGTISDDIGISEKAKTDTYSNSTGDDIGSSVEKSSLVSRTATRTSEKLNDTYSNNTGDDSRSSMEESSLVSGTVTTTAEKLNDRRVNVTNKSIADESVCGSEEQTGTKRESKDDNLLKDDTVRKVEGSTYEAKLVRVNPFDDSSARLESQDGELATEEGIKEEEKDRSDKGEKPCTLVGVAVAETDASATKELYVNATESSGTRTEHSIMLLEENNVAMQHHPASAYIASTRDDTSKMISENDAMKATLPTPLTMPLIPSNIAAEDRGGNDVRRIVHGPDSLVQEGSDAAVKQGNGESVPDASLDSSGSLEGHWGSVSVLSTRSDTSAVGEAEALPSNDSRVALEHGKSRTNSGKAEPEVKRTGISDVFEPPSFMTLIERRGSNNDQNAAALMQRQEQLKSPSVQAGWLPSLSHVTNDSQGRKKNEEIIAKVTNWSPGKQHSPLKNLLVQANRDKKLDPTSPREGSASATQKEENAVKDNGSGVTTVGSILSADAPDSGAAKKQVGQEWNSPARYPEDMKREKRKAKGRSYWVQFVCCASAN